MTEARTTFDVGYAAVERALVETHRIPRKAVGAFRGRLGALQKGGLFGAKNMPGKGKALRYRPDLLHRVIFACELLEFGFSPAVILSVVKSAWDRRLRRIFQDAESAALRDPGPSDVVIFMGGVHLMGDAFTASMPAINSCVLGKLPDHIRMLMSMTPDDQAGVPPRALVSNLTMRLRAFHNALAASYMDELRAEGAPPGGQKDG